MAEEYSIESLRVAIQESNQDVPDTDGERFEAQARRYEKAVAKLVDDICRIVSQIPELTITLEDETEIFTSHGYADREIEIHDQRVCITRDSNTLFFDPTAKAHLSAMGQVEIQASRPLRFMIEKVLYLLPVQGGKRTRWGFRSIENLGGPPVPFTEQVLLRMLHLVFGPEEAGS